MRRAAADQRPAPARRQVDSALAGPAPIRTLRVVATQYKSVLTTLKLVSPSWTPLPTECRASPPAQLLACPPACLPVGRPAR